MRLNRIYNQLGEIIGTHAHRQGTVALYDFLHNGERIALAVLSGVSASEFPRLVQAGDVTALMRIPRIDKKTVKHIALPMRWPQYRAVKPKRRCSNWVASPPRRRSSTRLFARRWRDDG